MANVTEVKRDMGTLVAPETVATDYVGIDWTTKDESTIILVNNTGTSAVDVTIKAGNGVQGLMDEVISCAKGLTAITINSGRFMARDGKVYIKAASSISMYFVSAQGYGTDSTGKVRG